MFVFRWMIGLAALLALLAAGGCTEDGGLTGDDDDSAAADDDDDASGTLDEFFSLTAVHDIEFEVSDEGIEELLEEPREYTSADVTIDGVTYADAAIRLKGAAGSFVPLDGDYPECSGDGNGNPGKSAFIIDFNRHVSGQDHLGMKKLVLNNMVQDPSGIHEYAAYALFRRGGVPASRVGYAQVTLNDEGKGLYALIEANDDEQYLEAWYGASDGNLYEGEYGTDLQEGCTEWFDQDNGDDESHDDLAEFAAALDGVESGDQALEVLEQYLDLEEYLVFSTTEIYLGHWDGYTWSANNYKIHHELDGPWTFVPWGLDQVFQDSMGEYAGVMQGPGPSWHGGRVHEVCFLSDECISMLYDAFEATLERADQMDLEGVAEEARELVEPHVVAEAEAHGNPEITEEAYESMERFFTERRGQIESWLDCLVGGEVDTDGDGFNGCDADCDDWNPEIHPGGIEECDFVDNDCNGVLDDLEECPDCYETTGPDGAEYALCLEWLSWEAAQDYCVARGQDLASFHDEHTWEETTWTMMELADVWESWIGLNDLEQTGDFVWTDGSDLDYDHWAPDAPGPQEMEHHCVVNTIEGWWNHPCEEEHPFVCRSE